MHGRFQRTYNSGVAWRMGGKFQRTYSSHREACPSSASSHWTLLHAPPHPTPPHPPVLYKTPRPSKGRGPTTINPSYWRRCQEVTDGISSHNWCWWSPQSQEDVRRIPENAAPWCGNCQVKLPGMDFWSNFLGFRKIKSPNHHFFTLWLFNITMENDHHSFTIWLWLTVCHGIDDP